MRAIDDETREKLKSLRDELGWYDWSSENHLVNVQVMAAMVGRLLALLITADAGEGVAEVER